MEQDIARPPDPEVAAEAEGEQPPADDTDHARQVRLTRRVHIVLGLVAAVTPAAVAAEPFARPAPNLFASLLGKSEAELDAWLEGRSLRVRALNGAVPSIAIMTDVIGQQDALINELRRVIQQGAPLAAGRWSPGNLVSARRTRGSSTGHEEVTSPSPTVTAWWMP